MKRIILFLLSFYFLSSIKFYASDKSGWLKSGVITSDQKKLVESVTSYPITGTILSQDGHTHRAQQMIKDRTLGGTVPINVQPVLKHGSFSVLRGKDTDFKNCPSGATLFPGYPSLAKKFDALINVMITQPKFKAFFNKVHLNVLNELYSYLMAIYTNFNLQHVGIKETQSGQGAVSLQFNIPTFLQNEADYEANKKTLIINHLVNIIESQMNGKIKSIMPNIPHIFATSAGKTLIQNDYSIDITQFTIQQIDPGMKKYKHIYLNGLATYIAFFQEYTSYLKQPHPEKKEHFTAFVDIAETLNRFLYGNIDPDIKSSDPKQHMQLLLQKMDPPLFTFNYDDIRALKLIPHVAKSLPAKTKSIGWPSHIVSAAENETFISNHPIAYFKDNNGKVVKKAQAKHLYVVLQSGANFFQEELLAQPDWLNSWSGVVNILAACFGDFSALIGLGILDPCMEALIHNAVDTMHGKTTEDKDSFVHACNILLTDMKNQKIAKIAPPKKAAISTGVTNIVQSQVSADRSTPSSDDLTPSDSDLSPSVDDISGS